MTTDCGRASNGRYQTGCRCDACRAAHARAWKVREWRKASGRDYFVDAGPVRRNVEALYAAGYSRNELVRMGIPKSTLNSLMNGSAHTGRPTTRIKRETAERIEAVRGRALAPRQLVPAAAARAMLRRWVGAGVPVARVSAVVGVKRQALDAILHGRRDMVRAETLVALLEHREELDVAAEDAAPVPSVPRMHDELSDWEVEEAYDAHRAGTPTAELARDYGVTKDSLTVAFRAVRAKRTRERKRNAR